ncbi:MAG: UDP-glucose/GDP-mannose dehydrogenase family protein [Actinomycetota bacterium]|nr:UDP-glucose/GDP-mannose dehydrogenase family protein [Actinomycetota bacterium]
MSERPRLSVIGTGYLGATHAICMVELGFDVIGLDVDETKIARLRAGEVPFYEPGLPELLRKHIDGGRLRFTTSYEQVADFADVHFICVGTPQRKDGLAADTSHVEASFAALAAHLTRKVLVVGKSTVPAGTAARMERLLLETAPCKDVELAWNPEFLREGFAVEDTLRPDRMVFGVHTDWAQAQLRAAFEPVIATGCPVVVTDFATAELVKVAANSFLATKISFINAMAEVCEVAGGDVTQLAEAIGYDDRIGRRFLNAGLGFGGGCLPKDIRAFIARARELGVDQAVSFLGEVDQINIRRRERMVDIGLDIVDGSYEGKQVGVLGAAFKPNSDDVRESPALDVAASIGRRGGRVVVYDPQAMGNARAAHPELVYVDSLAAAAAGADVLLLLTEWDEFKALRPADLGELVSQRNIVDGRNVLDPVVWRAAGWHFRALGRP